MFKRFCNQMLEKILFLGFLFGLLYVLLIVSDTSNGVIFSARYYFWSVVPMVGFSLILALAETSYRMIVKNKNTG